MDQFLAALDQHPAVKHWAFSDTRPARDGEGRMEMHVSASQHKQVLRVSTVSPSFFATYGMTVLAGTPRTKSGEPQLVIDAKAAHLLGFPSPHAAVGATLRGGGGFLQEGTDLRRVTAVINDVKLESAREPALPQAFLLSDKPQWDLSIAGTDLVTLRAAVEELWKAHGPPLTYDIQSADEQRAAVYRQEQQLTFMLAAIAMIAAAVAMVGVYALVADTLRRRRTELVLHRLHGAGHAAIARQVLIEFAAPLLVAAAFALPLAAWIGQQYLNGFVDRVDLLSGLTLPLFAASIATLLITSLAALRHVRQALAIKPIEALL
jgi:putative ABC transport system permease protein